MKKGVRRVLDMIDPHSLPCIASGILFTVCYGVLLKISDIYLANFTFFDTKWLLLSFISPFISMAISFVTSVRLLETKGVGVLKIILTLLGLFVASQWGIQHFIIGQESNYTIFITVGIVVLSGGISSVISSITMGY